MLTEILLWLTILVSLLGIVVLLWKRHYPTATFILCAGLAFGAGLSYVDLQSLSHPLDLPLWRKYGLLLEIGTTLGFYYYTKTVFRDNSEIYKGPGFWLSLLLALGLLLFTVVTPLDGLIYSPDFAEEQIIFLTNAGFGIYLVLMLYLVFGLVQLERTLSGLHQLQRWNIKPEIIAGGLLLAGYALFFSHSLLYRSLDMSYLGLRSCVVIVAVLLLGYARLSKESAGKLALSRGIAHRSFVLLIVGGYLIVLGLVGEGLRYLNLDNTKPIIYAVLLLGSLGLAAVFLSERLRRKLKVVLHKNFYQSKYDYREQWETFVKQTSGGKSLVEVQSVILDLFCDSLACTWATLYLFDENAGTYTYVTSFPPRRDWRPFAADDPLLIKLKQADWICNLQEDQPELKESLISPLREEGAFVVVPLIFDEDLTGFIILGEQIDSGEKLTYEDYDLLRMMARQSTSLLHGLRLNDELANTRELAAIGKVSTFVLHDLKNQVSGLSLMFDNAKEYIDDPEFQQDMLETVDHTVHNMKGLIARLKNLKEKPQLLVAPVALQKVVKDAVDTANGKIDVAGDEVQIDADEEEIYKVILNLLLNAVEASPSQAAVTLTFGRQQEMAFVQVADKGCGMSLDFIQNRLFQPFQTTKKHGFGIGLYQCKQIVDFHGGTISVESAQGQGTTFTLLLPLAPDMVID